jgi:hypothetical protein
LPVRRLPVLSATSGSWGWSHWRISAAPRPRPPRKPSPAFPSQLTSRVGEVGVGKVGIVAPFYPAGLRLPKTLGAAFRSESPLPNPRRSVGTFAYLRRFTGRLPWQHARTVEMTMTNRSRSAGQEQFTSSILSSARFTHWHRPARIAGLALLGTGLRPKAESSSVVLTAREMKDRRS